MNHSTAILLRRAAAAAGRNPREVKAQWCLLDHRQRAVIRRRLLAWLETPGVVIETEVKRPGRLSAFFGRLRRAVTGNA